MIDSMIRAKLTAAPVADVQPNAQQESQGGVEHVDANGNRAIVYPDGTFKEV